MNRTMIQPRYRCYYPKVGWWCPLHELNVDEVFVHRCHSVNNQNTIILIKTLQPVALTGEFNTSLLEIYFWIQRRRIFFFTFSRIKIMKTNVFLVFIISSCILLSWCIVNYFNNNCCNMSLSHVKTFTFISFTKLKFQWLWLKFQK